MWSDPYVCWANGGSGRRATSASVAKHGYDAMLGGKLVTINQRSLSFLLNWVVPFLPRRTVLKIIANSQSK